LIDAMRKVVFLGNCQAFRFREMYAECFAAALGDEVAFVPSFGAPTEEGRALLAQADVVALQVFDQPQAAGLHNLETAARIVRFPTLSGMFLWPSGGEPHPANKAEANLPGGPFDLNMGDRFLNRALRHGALPPDRIAAAADDYVEMDLARTTQAERVYELMIDRQKQRDAACGFDCATIIEDRLQDDWLFPIAATFNLALFRHMATRLYDGLAVPAAQVTASIAALTRPPFPDVQRPIHPSIVKCFGLKFVRPDQTYISWTGELLSVRDYAVRYLEYSWNAPLLDAILAVEHRRVGAAPYTPETVAATIAAGLAGGRPSARAERALSEALLLQGDEAGAMAAYDRAMAIDPDEPHAIGHYAYLLSRHGRADEAVPLLRDGARKWPADGTLWHRLAQTLLVQDRLAETVAALAAAIAALPHDPSFLPPYRELCVRLFRQDGASDDVVRHLRNARDLQPASAEFAAACADLLGVAASEQTCADAACSPALRR
jgi:tetratricopeptide (TPR) repeat protein